MALTPGTRRLMREAVSWGVVALIGVAALIHLDALRSGTEQLFGLPPSAGDAARQDAADGMQAAAQLGSLVEIKAGRNGHFNTEAEVNGRPIEVMIDTGATIVALSYEDAERAGLYLNQGDFTGAVTTANGVARVAPVTLDRVSIGDITVRDVPAAVAEPGRLKTSLLGMSFLNRLSRFDMRPGVLVLQD
ncbi:MAG TPA: TIGR02281 family clan AA aspartic protease [Hyphomicrobium sp.]|jgi:aspartyl protease family protein